MPPIGMAPKPTTATFKPVRPSGRFSIVTILSVCATVLRVCAVVEPAGRASLAHDWSGSKSPPIGRAILLGAQRHPRLERQRPGVRAHAIAAASEGRADPRHRQR